MAGNVAGLADQGAGALGIGEGVIDKGEDVLGRAIGGLQRHALEGGTRSPDQGVIDLGFLTQPLGAGALEGVDRLLFVADGEDGPVGFFAREELPGQGAHDGPLLGGGVLGLVDQDVVDAAVQLVEHPGGGRARGQQVDGLGHQIGEVQRPALGLGRLVEGRVVTGQGQQLDGVGGDLGGAHHVQRGQVLGLQIGQPAAGVGRGLLGGHRLARRA